MKRFERLKLAWRKPNRMESNYSRFQKDLVEHYKTRPTAKITVDDIFDKYLFKELNDLIFSYEDSKPTAKEVSERLTNALRGGNTLEKEPELTRDTLEKVFYDKKRSDIIRNIVMNSPCSLEDAIYYLKDSKDLELDAEVVMKYSDVGYSNRIKEVLSILNS